MHIYFHKGTSIWFFTISQSQFLKCNMGQAVFQRNFREGETMCTPCLSQTLTSSAARPPKTGCSPVTALSRTQQSQLSHGLSEVRQANHATQFMALLC